MPRREETSSKRSEHAHDDLSALIPSWELSLVAANKSPRTIETYIESARQLREFLGCAAMPVDIASVRREHIEAWIVDLATRRSPATVSVRFRAVQQFWRWLTEEGECERNPMARMSPPTVPERAVPVVADADLKRLIRACEGTRFTDRRDLALIRFMVDTGARRAEVIGLEVADLDLRSRTASVLGKGRRQRVVAFSTRTARDLDRYVRARARHRDADSGALWLGHAGPLGDSGLAQIIRRRGREVGLLDLHPHQLRHTWASRSLAAGVGEQNVMALGGWRSQAMLGRYGAAEANTRAVSEHQRLGLGDDL